MHFHFDLKHSWVVGHIWVPGMPRSEIFPGVGHTRDPLISGTRRTLLYLGPRDTNDEVQAGPTGSRVHPGSGYTPLTKDMLARLQTGDQFKF